MKSIVRRTTIMAVATSTGLVLAACGAGDSSGTDDGPVQLTFQALAFQPESIEANKEIRG